VTPYESPPGTMWEFEEELYVMLEETPMGPNIPYRRYVNLDDGSVQWIGRHSHRDDDSEMFT